METFHKLCLLLLAFTGGVFVQAHPPDPCEVGSYELSTSEADVSCFGGKNGSATVASTGCECAFSGCTFEWSDGQIFHTAENLAAGTYGVTVTHPDGCVMTTSVEIHEPDAFVEEISLQAASCHNGNDGMAEVIPTGSAGPLVYLWSNGDTGQNISNFAQGGHSVTVTNLVGCSVIDTFDIMAPPPAMLSVSVMPTCAGESSGSATVTPDGGNPPYSFLWNNFPASEQATAENLAVGTYRVTVTDGTGCTTVSEPIAVNAVLPNVSATSSATEVCAGETVSLQASGGVDYEWSPADVFNDPFIANPTINISESTALSVLVTTAEGCRVTRNISLNVLPAPQPDAFAVTPNICAGQSTQMIASNGTGAASFQWFPNDGLSNANINAPIASPSQTTVYTVIATDANGCTASTDLTVTVDVCSGIEDEIKQRELLGVKVFPNPSEGDFTVFFETQRKSDVTLSVFNTAGMRVYNNLLPDVWGSRQSRLNLSHLPSGLYLLQLQTEQYGITQKVMRR